MWMDGRWRPTDGGDAAADGAADVDVVAVAVFAGVDVVVVVADALVRPASE